MARSSRFLEAIQRRMLVLDAGIGLRLILSKQIGENESSARANLELSEQVLALHQADIEAGSDAILTNTFATNRSSLVLENRADDFLSNNTAAVALARQAAGPSRFVIGSIGPTLNPCAQNYRDQAVLLAEQGVDALILETHTIDAARVGLAAISRQVQIPIVVSLYLWPANFEATARELIDLGVSALGANCGKESADVFTIIERLAGRVSVPLIAKPSAGSWEGPEVFAELAIKFRQLGVRLIGGCCGTTSAHIAAIRRAVDRVES